MKMYHCVIYRPSIDLAKINSFREKFDPYYPGVGAHITLVFPVPVEEVSDGEFIEHITRIISNQKPFEAHLNGFEKSVDHWLFLSVKEGNKEIVGLHDQFYTGPLRKYLREDLPFSAHVGMGLFTKQDSGYDLEKPTILELDASRYETALKEAESLNIDYRVLFDRVSIIKVENDLKTIVSEREISL